tara:strand:- start:586 stop:1716 length:1131 start_codon:yes stop_codon:yes gene_type:complete
MQYMVEIYVDYFGDDQEQVNHPYTLENFIGSGGMGTVFKITKSDWPNAGGAEKLTDIAHLPYSEENVIVSPARMLLLDDNRIAANGHIMDLGSVRANKLRRALYESEIMKELKSEPHVIQPGENRYVNFAGTLTFVTGMGYVPGKTVHDYLLDGLDSRDAGKIIADMGQALKTLEKRGIVHRDVKPKNVMYTPFEPGRGNATLIDFGLAIKTNGPPNYASDEVLEFLMDDSSDYRGKVAGTPGYLAPEEVRGDPVTEKTDTFTLGLLAYELFTGEPAFRPFPFDGEINLFDNLYKLATFDNKRRKQLLDTMFEKDIPLDLGKAVDMTLYSQPEMRVSGPLIAEARYLASGEDRPSYEIRSEPTIIPELPSESSIIL